MIIYQLLEFLKQENLIKLYHGTNKIFDSFQDNSIIFFTDDKNVAKTYGKHIIEAIIYKFDNYIDIDCENNSTIFFNGKTYLPSQFALHIKALQDDISNNYQIDDEILEELNYYGYNPLYGDIDGIIMRNIQDNFDFFTDTPNIANNYVIFNINKIKQMNYIE